MKKADIEKNFEENKFDIIRKFREGSKSLETLKIPSRTGGVCYFCRHRVDGEFYIIIDSESAQKKSRYYIDVNCYREILGLPTAFPI